MQSCKLDPTGLARPGETGGLTGMGQGFNHQEAEGWVFGLFWNQTKPFFWSKPGPLASYLDPLLTLCRMQAVYLIREEQRMEV